MWHTIKSTDEWLSKLAAQYLGDPMKYNEIYNMNKDVLTSGPDVIRPGMTLWIPIDGKPKPTSGPIVEPEYRDVSDAVVEAGMNKWFIIGGVVAIGLAFFLSKKKS